MTLQASGRVADALVDRNLVTADDLAAVRAAAEAEGRDVVEELVSSGRVRRVDALEALADQLGVEFIDLGTGFVPDPRAIGRFDSATAVSEVALPVRVLEGVLTVAVVDPLDETKKDRLRAASHLDIDLALAAESALVETVRRVYLAQQPTNIDPDAPTPIGVPAAVEHGAARYHINELLELLIDRGGSDLHLSAGAPPRFRINGRLAPVEGYDVLAPAELREMIYEVLTARQREQLEDKLELDASHPVPGKGRFRTNVFFQRGSIALVMRAIPNRIASLTELGLPPVVAEMTTASRGLILVTGPTGSGKSTTLAAMVDLINSERPLHVVTVEDPIEFMHSHKESVVNQREVGADTHSFAAALRHVLRQDPDVILVGEMRDLETISTALTAAETGHLVLATLHTVDAPGSVERMIDVFPPHQQQQVRVQLAESLHGVISQMLLPTVDGESRVPSVEVLVSTPAIRNLIREGKIPQIRSAMQAGGQHGMQTMDKSLAQLVKSGKVDLALATEKAHFTEDFMNLIRGGVVR